MNLTINRVLAIAALILAILTLVVPGGFPFLTAAVICLAVALLV